MNIKSYIPQRFKNYFHYFNSFLAAARYGFPSRKLTVIGVTGTDGKTTTTSLIYHMLKESGKNVGMVSTVNAVIKGKTYDTGIHTTSPEPSLLQKVLRDMVDQKCEFAVLEVTSHALDQGRVFGVNFDAAAVTNITHEHLDYHGSFENYREAKSKLIASAKKCVVLNKDDASYKYLKRKVSKNAKSYSYSLVDKKADIYCNTRKETVKGISFRVKLKGRSVDLSSNLFGEYNISNIMAAFGVCKLYGVSDANIKKALLSFKLPVGRLEEIKNKKGITVYIDFAHTPNSLDQVLGTLAKRKGKGKLISIISCTGGRDKEKRPIMADIATTHSDYCVFTADDPRHEDVQDIFDQMEKGVSSATNCLSVEDYEKGLLEKTNKAFFRIPERQEAIIFAINALAKKGDIVAVCGKGHETAMAIGDLEQPYSDSDSVQNALKANNNSAAIILAAGKGTRLNSEVPKVLRTIADRPLIYYTLSNLRFSAVGLINLVVGFRSDLVKKQVGHAVSYSIQDKLLGTGHATKCGVDNIPNDIEDVFVLYSDDSAFYNPETIQELYKKHINEKATISFIVLNVKDPTGLGRVITNARGKLISIVEEKDASESEKKIQLVNDGLYVFKRAWLVENLNKIKKKAQGEYLLTDAIEIALAQNKTVSILVLKDESQWVGVNTPEQLEKADHLMRERLKYGSK